MVIEGMVFNCMQRFFISGEKPSITRPAVTGKEKILLKTRDEVDIE